MSQAVESLLGKELAAVDQFLDLLREEQRVLQEGPAERLRALGEEKLALVDALNCLESEREKLLAGNPGPSNRARMESWLAGKAATPACRTQWAKLMERAGEARRLHTLNAEMVNSLLRRTGEAIDILMQRKKEAALYGSDGQATEVTGSRIVDSA